MIVLVQIGLPSEILVLADSLLPPLSTTAELAGVGEVEVTIYPPRIDRSSQRR
jgi:hypothetical protein